LLWNGLVTETTCGTLTVLFGENPTGAERLAFGVMLFIPDCLPELADLTDAELRDALRTTILRMLRG
jgi:hypothetical protein